MSLTIGVDLDGCLCDFHRGWQDRYTEWFGVPPIIDVDVMEQWDFPWKVPAEFEIEKDFWDWADAVPRFWEDLPTVPGAMGALYRFQFRFGHEVRLLTSRSESARAGTRNWIAKHFPVHNVVPPLHFFLPDKKGVMDVQVYIDDDPVTLESLRGRPCVIIFDRPWNRDVRTDSTMHRCRGWEETVAFVERLESRGS